MIVLTPELTAATVSGVHDRIAPHIVRTPVVRYDMLGRHNELWIKDETLQRTRTFKLRGALALASHLKDAGEDTVVTASAGNHGSGVAASMQLLDMRGRIFVPETTPSSKLDNIRTIGGSAVELVVVGRSFDETARHALEESQRTGIAYLPPYDHPLVIAGQGTMTKELLEDLEGVDRIFVPVGGGGALAGALQAIEETGHPARVVAVQFSHNTSMERSVACGQVTSITQTDDLCEGSSVRAPGRHNFEIVHRKRDRVDFVTVDREDIGRELMYQDLTRQTMAPVLGRLAFEHFPETTGVLASAGARIFAEMRRDVAGERWVSLMTGANTDPSREVAAISAWKKSEKRF